MFYFENTPDNLKIFKKGIEMSILEKDVNIKNKKIIKGIYLLRVIIIWAIFIILMGFVSYICCTAAMKYPTSIKIGLIFGVGVVIIVNLYRLVFSDSMEEDINNNLKLYFGFLIGNILLFFLIIAIFYHHHKYLFDTVINIYNYSNEPYWFNNNISVDVIKLAWTIVVGFGTGLCSLVVSYWIYYSNRGGR